MPPVADTKRRAYDLSSRYGAGAASSYGRSRSQQSYQQHPYYTEQQYAYAGRGSQQYQQQGFARRGACQHHVAAQPERFDDSLAYSYEADLGSRCVSLLQPGLQGSVKMVPVVCAAPCGVDCVRTSLPASLLAE